METFSELASYIKDPIVMVSIVSNIVMFLANIGMTWWNARQKYKLDKEMEKHKNDLQVEYLKAQLKTSQFFIIYPELFSKIKMCEGSLARIKIIREKNEAMPSDEEKSAENDLMEFNNYLICKSLFLSTQVEKIGISLKDLMYKFLYPDFEIDKPVKFDEISKTIDLIQVQMKKELSNKAN